MNKRVVSALLALCMVGTQATSVFADLESDLREEQAYTAAALEATYSNIDSLYYQKEIIEGQIEELDSALVNIMISIDVLTGDIEAKEAEIQATEENLEKAKNAKGEQYDAMKLRIKYLYENGGDEAWLTLMMSADNLSDLLTKAEYTQEMYDYDRECLEKYTNTVDLVEELEEQYKLEKADLETMEQELEAEQSELEYQIEVKQTESADCDAEISYAYYLASEYEALIVQQQAEIDRLEAERIAAEEEAARIAAAEAAAAEEEAAAEVENEYTDDADGDGAEEDAPAELPYKVFDEDGDEISVYTAAENGYIIYDEEGDMVNASALVAMLEGREYVPEDEEGTDTDADEYVEEDQDTDNDEDDYYEDDYDEDSSSSSGSSSYSSSGSSVVDYALQFVGNPYVYGGTSLTNGADCSGFVQSVYASFGVDLPRTSYEQAGAGYSVSASDMQPGDLVCYGGHVAIYIGDGKIVHASSSTTGIIVSDNYAYRTIVDIRRVI